MRTIQTFGVARILSAITAIVVTSVTVFGQSSEVRDGNKSIPDGVFAVVKPACMACHSNEGKDKPKAAVNFSTWDQYTSTEKMLLAASVKAEVQEKKMPPKRYLETHPEAMLNEAQLSVIVQWCDSLKAKP